MTFASPFGSLLAPNFNPSMTNATVNKTVPPKENTQPEPSSEPKYSTTPEALNAMVMPLLFKAPAKENAPLPNLNEMPQTSAMPYYTIPQPYYSPYGMNMANIPVAPTTESIRRPNPNRLIFV